MPTYYPRQRVGRLSPDGIWRSAMPEDMKRRLARHLVDCLERERQAEREGVAIASGDVEPAQQAERDNYARSMGDWGQRPGRRWPRAVVYLSVARAIIAFRIAFEGAGGGSFPLFIAYRNK